MSAPDEPWYQAAFRDDYRLVYAHRDLDSARVEVGHLQSLGVSGRVLDLCCGFGRHTLALAEQGLDVFGMDLSMDLLRAAADLPGFAQRLAGRLVRGDVSGLPFETAAFDSVVVLFSSFGYFGEEGDRRMLDEIARVLRPGGLAVLDLMNPARIREGLVPASERSGVGFTLIERRSLVEGGRRVRKQVELSREGEAPRTWVEDVRMYEAAEITELCTSRGLAIERMLGDFGGPPLEEGSPRMITLARRGAMG
jgi:SAM-dependent methyltransferase